MFISDTSFAILAKLRMKLLKAFSEKSRHQFVEYENTIERYDLETGKYHNFDLKIINFLN